MIFNKSADYSDLIESVATYFNIKADGHVFSLASDNKSMSIGFANSKCHFVLFTITDYGIAVSLAIKAFSDLNTKVADMTISEYLLYKTFEHTLINLTIEQ